MKCCDFTEYTAPANAGWKAALQSLGYGRFLLSFSALILSLVTMVWQGLNDGEWTFWVSNFVFFGLLLNYLAFLRPRKDVFEPVILVATMFLLAFVLRGLFLHFDLDARNVNPWVHSNLRLLGNTTSYAVAGFLLFLLAYYSPLGPRLARWLPRMRTAWDMPLLGARAVRVYCFCLPAKLLSVIPPETYAFQDVVTRYLGNVIGLMASLTDVALLLYGIYYYHHKRRGIVRRVTPFWIMLVLQLLLGFLTGYREPLFVSLLALLFVRHYLWRPLKPHIAIAGFLVLMVAITPLSRAYRHLVWVERRAPLTVGGDLFQEAALHVERHSGPGERSAAAYGLKSLLNISNRFHGTDSLITCTATVPDYLPYQKGKTLYLLPLTVFVPRAFWPEKPKIGLGTFFRENIWKGPRDHARTGGQIAITQIGELYINFGLWGIMIGMLILGVFHRVVYHYSIVGHQRGSYSVLLFYFAAVLCFLAIERNFAFSYGYLLKLFIFLYFLCRYLNKGPVFSRT